MKSLLVGIGVVILGVGAWFFWSERGEKGVERQEAAGEGRTETQEKLPTTLDTATTPSRPNMIGSIKEAMGLGNPMQCTYTTPAEQGGVTAKMYVAGKKFKTEAVVGGMTTQALFDGETQYVWTSGSTQGMKMSQSCLESFKSVPTDQAAKDAAPRDYQQSFDAAQNVQCEPVETDMTLIFSVPKEVTFSDQCAMMEESKKMMEQYKDKMPAGLPSGMPVQY